MVKSKPPAADFKSPVRWLLGSRLVASLKTMALSSILGRRFDPRTWMSPEELDLSAASSGDELWFDYMADTGDGQRAVYSLAYLCLSDLWAMEGETALGLEAGDEARRLPRGSFLLIGGDTGYHVADYATLAERLQAPFTWAARDVERDSGRELQTRPLFGIPGNHDYYDFLDGFNRQFRRPFSPEATWEPGQVSAQLHLPGFERLQQTCFLGLALPFGWRLWGLDAQGGSIDRRQRHFFQSLQRSGDCTKLIVATPEPSTVLGQRSRPTAPLAATLEDIGLERPFLSGGRLHRERCRLDLSGDVHHYERYWGPDASGDEASYASVVSGGGGSFLHPTHANFSEIEQRATYPEPRASHRIVTRSLLNPLRLIWGGWVWLLGACLALLVVFSASIPESSASVVQRALETLGLPQGALTPESGRLARLAGVLAAPGSDRHLLHGDLLAALLVLVALGLCYGLSASRRRRLAEVQSHEEREAYQRWTEGTTSPADADGGGGRPPEARPMDPVSATTGHLWIQLFFLASLLASGLWLLRPERQPLHPFAASCMLVLCGILCAVGLVWSSRYRESFYTKLRDEALSWADKTTLGVIVIWAVVVLLLGLHRFGTYPVAVVTADVLFASVVLALITGATFAAVSVGAARHGPAGKAGFALLGLVHGLVQLALPLLLLAFGTPTDILAALLCVLAASLVGIHAADHLWRLAVRIGDRRFLGPLLLCCWLLLVGLVLGLVYHHAEPQPLTYWRLGLSVPLGALLGCTLFGWYLAVSLAFHGHNNEAGASARLQSHREFLRIRLRPDGLTVYAIGIDEPRTEGARLEPKLVDVFELRVRP